MAKKEEKSLVKEDQNKAITTFDYGDDAADFGQIAAGFEGQNNEDIAIPFIKLLQPNSPQVAGQLIEGIAGGQYFNTITQQLWKNPNGLLFVIGATRHEYLQFRPEKHGSGFVGRHAIDSPVVLKAKSESKEFGTYFVDADGRTGDDGDELSETFSCFGAWGDDAGNVGMAILPFKSTGIKTYKNMMTQIRSHTMEQGGRKVTPPLFAHLCRFTSEFKQRDKQSWWEPRYAPANGSIATSLIAPDDPRFQLAKSMQKMVVEGTAKVDYSKMDGKKSEKGDDIPF